MVRVILREIKQKEDEQNDEKKINGMMFGNYLTGMASHVILYIYITVLLERGRERIKRGR